MNQFDVIVIGGGASGMLAAIEARKKGASVCILERFAKLGKKILATGNGRCNLTNLSQKQEDYRSNIPSFAWDIIQRFGVEETLQYFEKLGVFWKEERGYVYPRSEQATAIVTALELKIQSLNIQVFYEKEVIHIEKKNQKFCIKTKENECFYSNDCIVATGGKAQEKLGSNGSGYVLVKQLGHTITPIAPALTGLHTDHIATKTWAGVRANAAITCIVDGVVVAKEQGEIQFTNYGISGVPTFQISRYATLGLKKKSNVEIILDFCPEYSKKELKQHLFFLINQCYYKNIRELLEGIFSKKIVPILLQEVKIKDTTLAKQLSEQKIHSLLSIIKQFQLRVIDSNCFEQSQVCVGGVDVREIKKETMESKLVKGLYITGELLDVDGTCGGYNLQWAWATGYIAGSSIQIEQKKMKERNQYDTNIADKASCYTQRRRSKKGNKASTKTKTRRRV